MRKQTLHPMPQGRTQLGVGLALLLWCLCALPAAAAEPLASFDYRVVGIELRPARSNLSVPKGIPGKLTVEVVTGAGERNEVTAAFADGAVVQATLRGPSFAARVLEGAPDGDLRLPPLPVVGDYHLDDIKLVDEATGETLLEGTPSSIPVRVFSEVLVSRVTSRPLELSEIEEKGIVIDETNFRALEFVVAFVIDGETVPVSFPVVSPRFRESTEIIPAAEIEARLVEAERMNRELGALAELPEGLSTAGVQFEIQGINFQFVAPSGEKDLALGIPPIPGVMVIPGNIGFLNQFFSVQLFTENAAPTDSGLSVHTLSATLELPPGDDPDDPDDDPLRFALLGAEAEPQPTQPILGPGADATLGTSDDLERLHPGDTGQAEFLVEGLKEGLHLMDLEIHGTLDGLGQDEIQITGRASGSVLVRNPKFSLAFSHPRTIRAGEPYKAVVTVLNTSPSVANLVSVSLPEASISGARFEEGQPGSIELETIAPGETKTAEFRLVSLRTGEITFSNLTSDEDIEGRFRLKMGVDERGVELSPDTIIFPNYVDELPSKLFFAANRVLGQALSVATAGKLPAGVVAVSRATLQRRSVELAEAGQRLRYGCVREEGAAVESACIDFRDPIDLVVADLLFDWMGARFPNDGFDQIMRTTEAGLFFRQEAAKLMEETAKEAKLPIAADATSRLTVRAADFAGRGQAWRIASADDSSVEIALIEGDGEAGIDASSLPRAAGARGDHGSWLLAPGQGEATLRFTVTKALEAALDLSLLEVGDAGEAKQLTWTLPNDTPVGACFEYAAKSPPVDSPSLSRDLECDGVVDDPEEVAASVQDVDEEAPRVLAVLQDLQVVAGRPEMYCDGPGISNYATVLAVLFSKPMHQAQANVPTAYTLGGGNGANSVQMQPGGRVALLNLKKPVGKTNRPSSDDEENPWETLVPVRELTVGTEVTDPRGNPISGAENLPITMTADQGVSVKGRVVRANGSFAVGVPVTLTMHDSQIVGLDCIGITKRISQPLTDEEGRFDFDYVPGGLGYTISATDTSDLSPEALALILASTAEADSLRAQLEELASQPSVKDSMLEAFAVGAMPQAIAVAEGLDRAVFRDFVDLAHASHRKGTQVPIALRFRGRGTVQGTVFDPTGSQPVADVAVNLFPDVGSREKGRGIFTDSQGRFAFYGVPLGLYSMEATSSRGPTKEHSGLISEVGQVDELELVLTEPENLELTSLRGLVTEENGDPHPRATVLVGNFTDAGFFAYASVEADAGGYWQANDIPVGKRDVAAISFDGVRQGRRFGIDAAASSIGTVNLTLQGTTSVTVQVEFANGQRVGGALVAGGQVLVETGVCETDPATGLEKNPDCGRAELTGVPTGGRDFSAALERDPESSDPRRTFNRLGGANANILPGVANFVTLRFNEAGRIVGRVVKSDGEKHGNVNVAIPQQGGFRWVTADADGVFVFENMALDEYLLSAPAPLAAETDVSGIIDTLGDSNSSQQDMLGAVTEALEIFTGVNDPLVNGEGLKFNPATWGYTETSLNYDGETKVIVIRYLKEGTVSGTVMNGQGVPIGARVQLTGVGPTTNGDLSFVVRGEMNSDPALGTFSFPGQVFEGSFGLQAASPFFPVIAKPECDPHCQIPRPQNLYEYKDIELKFPVTAETNGELVGVVLDPDGNPVTEKVLVLTHLGGKCSLENVESCIESWTFTDENIGHFDTALPLPALDEKGRPGRAYFVEAIQDPDNPESLRAGGYATVMPNEITEIELRFQAKGELDIEIQTADGSPVENKEVSIEVRGGAFPYQTLTGLTTQNGEMRVSEIFPGPVSVSAKATFGATTQWGRAAVDVVAGETAKATVKFAPTARLRGHFVQTDGITPVAYAKVSLSGIGWSSTGVQGEFPACGVAGGADDDPATEEQCFIEGLPLGKYTITAEDPVNGRIGRTTATLEENNEEVEVWIRQEELGEVFGVVIDSTNSSVAAGARVTLSPTGPSAARTVTSDPNGLFRFPGVPVGDFRIYATSGGVSGHASGTLEEGIESLEVNVALEPLADATVRVFLPDGVTPAPDARVVFTSGPRGAETSKGRDTDAEGRVSFEKMSLGPCSARASSGTAGQTNSLGSASCSLTEEGLLLVGEAPDWAAETAYRVDDVVRNPANQHAYVCTQAGTSSGTPPDGTGTAIVDGGVTWSFVGDGPVNAARYADEIEVVLKGVGKVSGRVFSASGDPVEAAEVSISFEMSPLEDLPNVGSGSGGTSGGFTFENVPLGPFRLVARNSGLSATASGEITPEDVASQTAVAVDLQLGDSGKITGEVVDPDGNPVVGADVVASYTRALIGGTGRAFYRTGEAGTFELDDVPWGEFELDVSAPEIFGIAKRPQPGETQPCETTKPSLDVAELVLGTVRLDTDFPMVEDVDPKDGAQGVATNTEIVLDFNEPLDPASVEISGFLLRGPGGQAHPLRAFDACEESSSPLENDDRRVRLQLAEGTSLESETTYQVIVLNGEVQNAVGGTVGRGPADLVGREMSAPFTAAFTTKDAREPRLLSKTPEDGEVQVDVSRVIRLSFDEPVLEDKVTVTLTDRKDNPVEHEIAVGVAGRVLVITPTQLLTTKERYTVTVKNVQDAAENLAVRELDPDDPTALEHQPFSWSFSSLDADGADIAALRVLSVPGGEPLDAEGWVAGSQVEIEAILVDSDEEGVSIAMRADFAYLGETEKGVRRLAFQLPESGSVTIRAVAIDAYGYEGNEAKLELTVVENTPPTVNFDIQSEALTGSDLVVEVSATDDSGVTKLKAVASGAGVFPLEETGGEVIGMTIPVDPAAGPGDKVTISAEAIDNSGASSGEWSEEVAVSDGTPPSVSILSPGEDGEEVAAGESFTVKVTAMDAFGLKKIRLTASGAVEEEFSESVDPNQAEATPEFNIEVPQGLSAGEAIRLEAKARNAAGLWSEPVIREVRVPDTTDPEVRVVVPTHEAKGVSPAAVIEIQFSEAMKSLDPEEAAALKVLFTEAGVVPSEVELLPGNQALRVTPEEPLAHGASYQVKLAEGSLVDRAGNPLAAWESSFTTGSVNITCGEAGDECSTTVVEHRPLSVNAVASHETLKPLIGHVEFAIGEEKRADSSPDPDGYWQAQFTVPEIDAPGPEVIELVVTAFEKISEDEVPADARSLGPRSRTLTVLDEDEDSDGDGILNGVEADAGEGYDPLVHNGDDPDGDGLTTARENELGTNPTDNDTDRDGLLDGDEIEFGQDPLNEDTDGDGILDGEDVGRGPQLTRLMLGSVVNLVTAAEPPINVSVRPILVAEFDDVLDPDTVSSERFTLRVDEQGTGTEPARVELSEDKKVLTLTPTGPLDFATAYVVEFSQEDGSQILGDDQEAIVLNGEAIPAYRFATVNFGITSPGDGTLLLEGSTVMLAASGRDDLGTASVEFFVNGSLLASDEEPPFETEFTVPDASGGSTLTLKAVARDVDGAEVGETSIQVSVVVGLHAERSLLGVPLCEAADVAQCTTRDIVLTTRSQQDSDVDITIVVGDSEVVHIADLKPTFLQGERVLRVPVRGAESRSAGATTVRLSSAADQVEVIVAVSPLSDMPEELTTPTEDGTAGVMAPPLGLLLEAPRSAGQVVVAPGATAQIGVGVFDEVVDLSTPVSVVTFDPALVTNLSASVSANGRDVMIAFTAGGTGETQLLISAGGESLELQVVVGELADNRTQLVMAPPVGMLLAPKSSSRLVLEPGATVQIGVGLVDATADVSVSSSNPAVADVAGDVTITNGHAQLSVLAGDEPGAAALWLRAGDATQLIEVVVGEPAAYETFPGLAPPVGLCVETTEVCPAE